MKKTTTWEYMTEFERKNAYYNLQDKLKRKKNKIWVLFSIANNYDQPEANLEAWWHKKPNLDAVYCIIGEHLDGSLRGILSGKEVRIDDTDYRLECIKEGKYEKN